MRQITKLTIPEDVKIERHSDELGAFASFSAQRHEVKLVIAV